MGILQNEKADKKFYSAEVEHFTSGIRYGILFT